MRKRLADLRMEVGRMAVKVERYRMGGLNRTRRNPGHPRTGHPVVAVHVVVLLGGVMIIGSVARVVRVVVVVSARHVR